MSKPREQFEEETGQAYTEQQETRFSLWLESKSEKDMRRVAFRVNSLIMSIAASPKTNDSKTVDQTIIALKEIRDDLYPNDDQ